MKARYQRITVCGTHSNNVTGDEEVLAVDRLAVTCKWIWWKCRTERKQVVSRQSFGKLNVECIGSSSSTGCSCDGGRDTTICSHLQSFERAFKKYSQLCTFFGGWDGGNSPQASKEAAFGKQWFCQFVLAITSCVENKAAAEAKAAKNSKRDALLKLLNKLDRGIISRGEFDQMKDM
jgi:hypothetical protein